jgi:hypothetical protein
VLRALMYYLTPMLILLDMDGVICDFVHGACAHHGCPVPSTFIEGSLNRTLGLRMSDFWKGIDSKFWSGLRMTSDGQHIIGLVQKFGIEYTALYGEEVVWIIVTHVPSNAGAALRNDPSCAAGKFLWMKMHLPDYYNKLFICCEKKLLASYNTLLIDDSDKNCNDFIVQGGQAILVPRPWNSGKDSGDAAYNVYQHLSEML